MKKASLSQRFIESKGKPLAVGPLTVVQMDRIPITTGIVSIRFLGKLPSMRGMAVKATRGWIELCDGRRNTLVHVWDIPNVPREASYRVYCPDHELRLWNIYKIQHSNGETVDEAWTANAGMVVKRFDERRREYACSDGVGEFDASEMIVEVTWTESL